MIEVKVERWLAAHAARFLERRRAEMEQLRDLTAKGDLAAVAALAHNIKGSGSTFGFLELSAIAAEVERLARDGVAGPLPEKFDAMASYLAQVTVSQG
jgi:HPt (histidine-containing phosphotransfer) domain-containing protein